MKRQALCPILVILTSAVLPCTAQGDLKCLRFITACYFRVYNATEQKNVPTWCDWTNPTNGWTFHRYELNNDFYLGLGNVSRARLISDDLSCSTDGLTQCLDFNYQFDHPDTVDLHVNIINAATNESQRVWSLSSAPYPGEWNGAQVPISTRFDFHVEFEAVRHSDSEDTDRVYIDSIMHRGSYSCNVYPLEAATTTITTPICWDKQDFCEFYSYLMCRWTLDGAWQWKIPSSSRDTRLYLDNNGNATGVMASQRMCATQVGCFYLALHGVSSSTLTVNVYIVNDVNSMRQLVWSVSGWNGHGNVPIKTDHDFRVEVELVDYFDERPAHIQGIGVRHCRFDYNSVCTINPDYAVPNITTTTTPANTTTTTTIATTTPTPFISVISIAAVTTPFRETKSATVTESMTTEGRNTESQSPDNTTTIVGAVVVSAVAIITVIVLAVVVMVVLNRQQLSKAVQESRPTPQPRHNLDTGAESDVNDVRDSDIDSGTSHPQSDGVYLELVDAPGNVESSSGRPQEDRIEDNLAVHVDKNRYMWFSHTHPDYDDVVFEGPQGDATFNRRPQEGRIEESLAMHADNQDYMMPSPVNSADSQCDSSQDEVLPDRFDVNTGPLDNTERVPASESGYVDMSGINSRNVLYSVLEDRSTPNAYSAVHTYNNTQFHY